jgi:enoyl-CoA hydratase/carnithine racemase
MSELITTDYADGVLTVTFNRPEKKNAINDEMWVGLREAFEGAERDPAVACVLLTGAGDNFSAGVDLASFLGGSEGGAVHPFDACARTVARFGKPLVAAARGVAVGGGATILFHADIVYVGESLRLRLPFASLGVVPEFASSYMLQANIGAQRAAELMFTAEWVDADKARYLGIAADVLPDAGLLSHAQDKASEIAQWPVNALREIKGCLKTMHRAGIEAAFEVEEAAMRRQAGSAENIEAVTAFMEKRPPDFRKLR